jgi:hypothetical protein
MLTEKTCSQCKDKKDIDQFHWKSKRRGTRQARCISCTSTYGHSHYLTHSQEYKDRANNRLKELRNTNRANVKSWLSSHPCNCGQSNPKVLIISVNSNQINNLSPEDLSVELEKSVVMCRNCKASQD